jgi:hypothetical protein
MYLALGTCRALVTMNHSEFPFLNTWHEVGNRSANAKHIIGRSWSPNEIFGMLMLILGQKDSNNYCGHEYKTYESIKGNIEFIRQQFHNNNIQGVVIEVASLKYYVSPDNKLVHNVIHEKLHEHPEWKEHVLTEEQVNKFLQRIIDFLPGKKIIFLNHFLHTKIPNRLLISQCLQKTLANNKNNNKNIRVLTPSQFWTVETESQWLKDPAHYHPHIVPKIANWIDTNLKQM